MKKLVSLILVALMLLSLGLSTSAASAKPSVEVNPAPAIEPVKDEKTQKPKVTQDGDIVVAEVWQDAKISSTKQDKKDQDVIEIELAITSYAEAVKGEKPADSDSLKAKMWTTSTKILVDAHESMTAVEVIADVNGEKSDLKAELDNRAKEVNKDYTADNYIVTSLFDMAVDEEEYAARMKSDDFYLRVTFKTHFDANKPAPAVIYRCEGDADWSIVDAKDVTVNKDGTLTVNFDHLCAIAFLELTDSSNAAEKTQPLWLWILLGVAGALLLGVIIWILVLLFRRKKKDEEEPIVENVENGLSKAKKAGMISAASLLGIVGALLVIRAATKKRK